MQDAVTCGAHRLHFNRQVRTVEDGRRKMAGSTKDRQVWANGEYLSGPRTPATKQREALRRMSFQWKGIASCE
jgi:hypothetical protein